MGGVVPLGYRVDNRALHVVEEHAAFVRDLFRRCNGALACLERGYRADAVLILEPQHEQLLSAQVGVIWFEVMIRGIPVHVANAGLGVNAIESAYKVIAALHVLEENWNARKAHYRSRADLPHPINLNVGRIAGDDWASSVPAWCAPRRAGGHLSQLAHRGRQERNRGYDPRGVSPRRVFSEQPADRHLQRARS
jgi:acetylornithine deacetylase/succinyl-diaminopimelate desuccinylase-like protein